MKTWLLAVVASVGMLSGCGGPMEEETGAPVPEGQVEQAACPDPAYCACTRACSQACGGTGNICFQQCASEC